VTVAAVILAARPDAALADADGVARVRRIADAAWSGGAFPIVVVSFDPDGAVAAALAGAPVTLIEPAPVECGPVAQICRGIDETRQLVTETDAVIVWPARMCWVGPETVTSLIEAHGTVRGTMLQPAFRGVPGWPCLLPIEHVETLRPMPATRMPDELLLDLAATGVSSSPIELGDPGTIIDGETPRSELPRYEGPEQPASGHVHEWGDAIGSEADRS
jgi:CTP:molybdopterin cytidylyltransferase MocA